MAGRHRSSRPAGGPGRGHDPGFAAEASRVPRRGAVAAAVLLLAAIVVVAVVLVVAPGDDGGRQAVIDASRPTAGPTTGATPTSTTPTPTTPAPITAGPIAAGSTTPAPTTRASHRTTRHPTTPVPRGTTRQPAVASVSVRAVRGPSWLTVRDHTGRTLVDGLLIQGTGRAYNDPQSLSVVIGDAAAVDLVVDSRRQPRGAPHQVLRLVVRPLSR